MSLSASDKSQILDALKLAPDFLSKQIEEDDYLASDDMRVRVFARISKLKNLRERLIKEGWVE